jgi:hypothetical protein
MSDQETALIQYFCPNCRQTFFCEASDPEMGRCLVCRSFAQAVAIGFWRRDTLLEKKYFGTRVLIEEHAPDGRRLCIDRTILDSLKQRAQREPCTL